MGVPVSSIKQFEAHRANIGEMLGNLKAENLI